MTDRPSMPHLERHTRDIETYRAQVSEHAGARFDPVFWGAWDLHVHPPGDGTIVDLGAGSGFLLEQLRARYPDARLLGVELHPTMLEVAQQAAARADATIIQGDLALPVALPDGSADVVVTSMVLHELPHPPALLDNAARLLRPGGRLVLADIVRWPLAHYLAERALDEDSLSHFQEHAQFTPQDVTWLVERAGFVVDEWITRHGGRFVLLHAHKAGPTAG